MKNQQIVLSCRTVVCALLVGVTFGTDVHAQFLLDTRGGVEVWAENVPAPAGLVAMTISLKTTDPAAKLVTFENVAIRGEVVQVFDSVLGTPTPGVADVGNSVFFDANWANTDSHLLITPEMLATTAGPQGFLVTSETNDGSLADVAAALGNTAGGSPAKVGIGDLAMDAPTDVFIFDTPFQSNEIEFAYIVTPPKMRVAFLTVGVLGEGIVNSGDPGGAQWGFGDNPEPLCVGICIPEPSTYTLPSLGLLGLLACVRRRWG
jgi:hypothetical protein